MKKRKERTVLKSGMEKNKREIAKKMLQKGNDITYIAEITGLAEEEIKKIEKE